MPQLHFHDFPPQLVWLAITFVILYVLMAKVALPKIGSVVEARQARITADLDRATKLKDEAQGVLAAYEKALADARANAQATIKAAAERMAKEAEAREGELAKKLAAVTEPFESTRTSRPMSPPVTLESRSIWIVPLGAKMLAPTTLSRPTKAAKGVDVGPPVPPLAPPT